ncbi:GY family cell surface protein [Levilactobacillus senmaizukei DSM 21775 = NBRC 103853]|uniref:GY family cell surface protein n=1 Tax=Levilactobacillus senmaizukei DSM 21775 = NBRC 103853 TaxID=1423803 RepID=A0A0R2DG78_9LACO|nr:MucBP domain-containing protein [Levilactobacillus senmaizukei]KRN03006.1 GY family cell surface protein [Levilactobacillus senmaizukei DSM 21775 = NBRC 103853]
MKPLNNSKRHYKMYKQGKFWVFAGIVSATLALAVPMTANAATDGGADQVPVEQKAPASDQPAAPVVQDDNGEKDPAAGEKQDGPAPVVTAGEKEKFSGTDVNQDDQSDHVVTSDGDQTTTSAPKKTLRADTPAAAPIALAPAPAAKADQSIDEWMPNKQLQLIVLYNIQLELPDLDLTSVDQITQDNIKQLTKLEAVGGNQTHKLDTYIDGKTAFSLEGLQYATGLTTINLKTTFGLGSSKYRGDIVDISPLAHLTNVTDLDLQHNRIQDVTPLATMTGLKYVYVNYNSIMDFSPIVGRSFAASTATFGDYNQVLILPTIKIDPNNPTATVNVKVVTKNGESDALQIPTDVLTISDANYGDGQSAMVNIYYQGGTPTANADGSLTYTDIKAQEPGVTTYKNFRVTPLANKYYLTAKVQSKNNFNNFQIIQPYEMATAAAPVNVHYVDETGATIHGDTQVNGMVGDAYTTTPLTIANYKLKTTPENATGTLTDTAIDVTYVYTADAKPVTPVDPTPDTTGTVTIVSVDKAGNVLAQSVKSGKVGDAYNIDAPAITGYKAVGDTSATGTFTASNQTVTFTYAKIDNGGDAATINPTTPTKPGKTTNHAADKVAAKPVAKPVDLKANGQAAKVTANASVKRAAKSDNSAMTLPQTGDKSVSPLAGLAVLIGSLGTLVFRKRN